MAKQVIVNYKNESMPSSEKENRRFGKEKWTEFTATRLYLPIILSIIIPLAPLANSGE
jgi:hypothetical protein